MEDVHEVSVAVHRETGARWYLYAVVLNTPLFDPSSSFRQNFLRTFQGGWWRWHGQTGYQESCEYQVQGLIFKGRTLKASVRSK